MEILVTYVKKPHKKYKILEKEKKPHWKQYNIILAKLFKEILMKKFYAERILEQCLGKTTGVISNKIIRRNLKRILKINTGEAPRSFCR